MHKLREGFRFYFWIDLHVSLHSSSSMIFDTISFCWRHVTTTLPMISFTSVLWRMCSDDKDNDGNNDDDDDYAPSSWPPPSIVTATGGDWVNWWAGQGRGGGSNGERRGRAVSSVVVGAAVLFFFLRAMLIFWRSQAGGFLAKLFLSSWGSVHSY